MTLMDIEELSATAIRETPVAKVRVASPGGLVATHTYAASTALEAVDVFGAIDGIGTADLECRPLPVTVADLDEAAGSHALLRAS